MSKASDLTNQIIDHIYKHRGYAWRASSVGIYDQQKHSFRTSPKKGVSDILACHQSFLVAIEVKIGKDKLRPEQEGFLRNVENVGGITMIVKTFDDFKKQWSEYLKLRYTIDMELS